MKKRFENYGKYIKENRGNPTPISAQELKKRVEEQKPKK